MKTTEEKLLKLMPEKEKKKYLAVNSTASREQVAEAERDLNEWIQATTTKGIHELNTSATASTNVLDIDDLLKSMNKSQFTKLQKIREECKVQEVNEFLRNRRAEAERRKGNESFRALDYDDALRCYSKSLAYDHNNAIVWANRAMAYIKKELFDLAEVDCNISLALDSSYMKALLRRGLVRFKLGKYREVILNSLYILFVLYNS